MVAKMEFDKGVSILKHSQFNYDGNVCEIITPDMAREVLNFEISKAACRTTEGLVIPRMNYLLRSDGGLIDANCSVGDEFEVACQPLELLEFGEGIIKAVDGLRFETVATMYNGGTSFLVLSFGDGYMIKGDSSKHYQNLVFANPCTRGKLHFVSSTIRVVCMNTLAASMSSGKGYRIAHTKNGALKVENALGEIRKHLQSASELREKCDFLASKQITTESINRILDSVYPLPIIEDGKRQTGLTRKQGLRDEVMEQFESDDSFTDKSYWAFLNAITYQSEHPKHKQERTDSAQIAYDNMCGETANKKNEILEAVYVEAVAA